MSDHKFPYITSPEIRTYCETHSDSQGPILAEIYERSLNTHKPQMVSGPFLGRYLSMISKIVAPKYILEVGTFTGYGTLCLLEGLQKDGKIITIEKSNDMINFSSDIFARENLQDRIVDIHGDASEVIPTLDYTFDLVFIDAAKRKYIEHYEMILPKLRPGGVILADNTLWKGKIVSSENDKLGQGLDEFNLYIKNDRRVENILVPIDDGVHFIRKR